ncbi:MAG: chalcone isomerase family protein [Myxococcota bacterium]
MRWLSPLFLGLVMMAAEPALAATLSGVTLSDSATVSGSPLVLNGIGARKKYMFTVYVGALYLPAKTTSAQKAINDDVAKKLVMHFVYSGGVTKKQLVDTYKEGLAKQGNAASLQAKYDTLFGMLSDVGSGDEIVFDYAPGAGTTVRVKGAKKGTISGKPFMVSLFTIYLGSSPPTGALKSGMMGG